MAEYIITTCDGETESVFLAYKEEQRLLRAQVSMQWQQAAATLDAYDAFAEKLAAGGELEAVADYHTAVAGQLAGAEQLLLQKIAEVKGLIEQINAVAPGVLFYGVPK